jgi:multidrug efflux pump subunit AcrB
MPWASAGSWRVEDEEQKAAGEFLSKAAAAAMFLIFVVLLAQFNRFLSVGWCCRRWSCRPSVSSSDC